jgi:hypothetical protein
MCARFARSDWSAGLPGLKKRNLQLVMKKIPRNPQKYLVCARDTGESKSSNSDERNLFLCKILRNITSSNKIFLKENNKYS